MEGYWKVRCDTGTDHGDGIAILRDGELRGGDFEHSWIGTYEKTGNTLFLRILIAPCVSSEEKEIMAKDIPLIFSLRGHCTETFAELEGAADHREGARIRITMRKCVATLPGQPFGKAA